MAKIPSIQGKIGTIPTQNKKMQIAQNGKSVVQQLPGSAPAPSAGALDRNVSAPLVTTGKEINECTSGKLSCITKQTAKIFLTAATAAAAIISTHPKNIEPTPTATTLPTTKSNAGAGEKAVQLGLEMLESFKTDKNTDFSQILQTYFAQENIQNIVIKDIKAANKDSKTVGGFAPKTPLGGQGGTLYIPKIENTNDNKHVLRTIQVIAHEVCHAHQDALKPFADSYENLSKSDKSRLSAIVGFVTYMKKYVINTLQQKPLQYIIDNYEQYKVNKYDLYKANEEIQQYGTIFPGKMKPLTVKDIYKAFDGKRKFEFEVRHVVQNFFDFFNNFDCIPEEFRNNPQSYLDILNYSIFELRKEAEAYQVNSDLNKKDKRIDLSENTLNDLIPMTYNVVADELCIIAEEIKQQQSYPLTKYSIPMLIKKSERKG